MELVEVKDVSKMKNIIDGNHNRLDTAEEKISEFENIALNAIQNEEHIGKKTVTSEQSLSKCETISSCLTYINWSPRKRRERWKTDKKIWRKNIKSFFFKLDKNCKPTDPRVLISFKQNKYWTHNTRVHAPYIHTMVNQNPIDEHQRKRKKNLSSQRMRTHYIERNKDKNVRRLLLGNDASQKAMEWREKAT